MSSTTLPRKVEAPAPGDLRRASDVPGRWAHRPRNPTTQRSMFTTGIECSCPTIALPDGRTKRVDELEKTRHYRYWREDLALVCELGIRFLRYGPPYYRAHLAPGKYEWSWTDQVLAEMRRL